MPPIDTFDTILCMRNTFLFYRTVKQSVCDSLVCHTIVKCTRNRALVTAVYQIYNIYRVSRNVKIYKSIQCIKTNETFSPI